MLFGAQLMAQNPLLPAQKFNVFTQGNATLSSNESESPIAIGGNLTVNGNYQVATNTAGDFTISNVPIGLVVGGGVTITSGTLQVNSQSYVKIGNCAGLKVWYKDNNDAFSTIRITKDTDDYSAGSGILINNQANNFSGGPLSASNNPVCASTSIDFAAAFATLKTNSANLSQCQGVAITTENANGETISSISGQNLYLDLPANPAANKPRIWNVSGSDLNSINEVNLRFTPTANEPLIINVSTDASFTWNVKNQNFSASVYKYVIWNFPNATTLNIEGSSMIAGSILAPNANVTKTVNQNNIEGQLIAQSFVQNGGEMHPYPFEGNVQCGAVICVKPNAGKDTTVCATSAQLKTPAQGETWSFLSSSNSSSATISANGLASNMSVTGQYRFLLKKDNDANCSDTVVVTKANFIIGKLTDDEICPGTTITFGYEGLSNVTYAWSTGGNGPSISVKPTQTTDYTVTVTSNTTGCVAKDTVKITVNPKPNAGQDKVVCTDNTTVTPAAQGETWSFLSFNNPNNSNETATANITQQGAVTGLTKAGFYRFVLTSNKGCTDTIRIQKRVVTLPNIVLDPVCPTTTVTFGYTNTTDFTYLWNTNETTAEISVKPTQTTDYIVEATEISSGCKISDTTTVTIKPGPVLTLVSSVCSQDQTSYVTTVTTTNGAVVTTNSGTVNGSGTSFTVSNASNVTTYTITAELDGCKTRLVVTKPDCSTNCNPPTPNGQGTDICTGATATISASGCNATYPLKWYSNAGLTTEITNGVSGNNLTINNLTTQTDYYAACVKDASCKSTGVKVTVTIKPLPTFSNTSTNCAANNSTYTVQISSTGTVTVKSPVAAQISGSGPYSISNIPAGTNLVLTSTLNGCSKDTTITAPNCGCTPNAPVALAANVGICEGSPIPTPTFTAIVGPNTTVDWYSASTGGALLQANSLTFTPTAAGTFYLQAKSTAQGCANEVNPVRVPVTLSVSPKPSFNVTATNASCQGSTPQNNGSVKITTGTVGQRYAFNTTGFGTLPTTATGSDTIKALPQTVAQNIANNIAVTTYYLRIFSNEGCFKDTSVVVQPNNCQPNCPVITLIGDDKSEACSGLSYLSAGSNMLVKVPSLDSVRFVYFTALTSDPYTGGTLITTQKPDADSVAFWGTTLGGGGIRGDSFPINNTSAPVTYYVYALLKSPVFGTACAPPSALKTYTLNPLPQIELDSVPACVGDTSYKINVKILSAGTFTIKVGTGLSSVGNGLNIEGQTQAINNAAGGGAVTQITLSTTGDFVVLVEDAKGCAQAASVPKPTFKPCDDDKKYDLALSKSISKKRAAIGDDITYTLKVWNEGNATATGVSVKDTLNEGVTYLTHATAFGNYNSTTKIWEIGEVAVGDTATLLLVVKVVRDGVWFNTAEICNMDQKDEDSTPCNNEEEEDDLDRECFSVPLKLCPTEAVEVTVPNNYTNVQWTKDGDANFTLSGNKILLSGPGIYRFTASNGTCPAEGCCPVEIIAGECCPPDLCVPFTIKQTKKGGKPVK
jgi:choice-of-anchor A domain-containing protein/uncharacterized repeat protein (TIGR01451 family)